jgi:hypothetical protein
MSYIRIPSNPERLHIFHDNDGRVKINRGPFTKLLSVKASDFNALINAYNEFDMIPEGGFEAGRLTLREEGSCKDADYGKVILEIKGEPDVEMWLVTWHYIASRRGRFTKLKSRFTVEKKK